MNDRLASASSRWRVAGALLLAAVAWFGGAASAADPLGRFRADPQQVSVAGICSAQVAPSHPGTSLW